MSAKTFCTLDLHRCDSALSISQGGLVVTTNKLADFHRKVLGTLAFSTSSLAFECQFWSTSRPTLGLVNLCAVGVASIGSAISGKFVGEDTTSGLVASCGLRPSNGTGGDTGAGIYSNNVLQQSFRQIDERQVIGVLLSNDPTTPIVAFHVNGNYLGQFTLPAGLLYAPAVSLGSTAAAGDVSAYLNFGQYALDFPYMSVSR
jgi:hypothetical protein